MLHSVREEIDALPQKHAALLDLFKSIRNKNDAEEYEQLLADEERRGEFYRTLTAFAKSLRIALSTELFDAETPAATIGRYESDLKRFVKLRASVQQRYADVVEMKKLEPQIAKLLDTYVYSDTVEVLTPEPVNIFDAAAMEQALEAMGTPAAKADTMAHAMARTITERMDRDPALYRKFSEMLRETIQAFREHLISEMEYLKKIFALRDQMVANTDRGVPQRLAGNEIAQAYYRVVMEKLDDFSATPGDREVAADVALMIEEAIAREVVVDWRRKPDVQKRMRANIDDGFFELAQRGKIALNWSVIDEIASEAERIAKSRLEP
jgi:type I restriction enzyme R subunit